MDNRFSQIQRLHGANPVPLTTNAMFSARPLTWLFFIAVVAFDFALLSSEMDWRESLFFIGGLFGQLSIPTIWAVRGHLHRLLRFAALAAGLWFVLFISADSTFYTFVFTYVVLLFAIVLLIELARHLQLPEDKKHKIRIPIIEFFGWTIVVAVISLSLRWVEFQQVFLEEEKIENWWQLFAVLAVPVFLASFIRKDLRDLRIIKALIVVAIAIAAGWYLDYLIVVSQSTFLVAWFTVITLDNVRAETIQIRSNLESSEPAVELPKIYNPHPLD